MTGESESMVERVARALCVADGHEPDSDWRIDGNVMLTVALAPGAEKFWRTYEPLARTAIEAMREPTEAMLQAAAVDRTPRTATNSLDRMYESVGHLYRAAIDAALSQGDER